MPRVDNSGKCETTNCDGGMQCYKDNGIAGCHYTCLCMTCTKGKCRPSMKNRGGINPGKFTFQKRIEAHEMSRFELALFKKGEKFLQSATFKRISAKIGVKYGYTPTIPDMCKVRLNRKFKTTGGMYYFDTQHIDISYSTWKIDKKAAHRTLKHEIIHLFVDFNYCMSMKNRVSESSFEKTCMFAFGFNGDHGAYPYMYTCKDCGTKKKTSEKRVQVFCRGCRKNLITQTEYNKLLKVQAIGSKYAPGNVDRYGLFKETKLIDI